MPSTKDTQQEDRGIFALFKGDSGSGKSVGALSFCDPNNDGSAPGFVFDNDKKMPGVAQKHFPDKEIHYETYPDIFTHAEKLNEFSIHCPYETIIEDSMTSLSINCLNSVGDLKGEKAIDMLKNLKRTASGGKMVELMTIDYYNAQVNFFERYWFDALKALWARPGNPKNVIIIAHVMTTESAPDLHTKIVTRTRSIVTAGRAISAFVPTVFDDMWHFCYEIDQVTGRNRHIVLTEGLGEDSAKTSFMLPYKIDFSGEAPLYSDGNLYKKVQKIIKGDMSL